MMVKTNIRFLTIFLAICTSVGYARAPQKILRGRDASIRELPHQVSLQTSDGEHFCGGTIISHLYILTAAHCIITDYRNSPIDVITGTEDKLNRTPDNVFHVVRRVHHANYDFLHSSKNDIAILKLDRPIPFNDFRRPAELPFQDVPINATVISSGWGISGLQSLGLETNEHPRYLQKLQSKVLELSVCQHFLTHKIYPEQLCTFTKDTAALCGVSFPGDSGGPVTYNDEVVGIISWGMGCQGALPDVATRVHNYIRWIVDVLIALTDSSDSISTSLVQEIVLIEDT